MLYVQWDQLFIQNEEKIGPIFRNQSGESSLYSLCCKNIFPYVCIQSQRLILATLLLHWNPLVLKANTYRMSSYLLNRHINFVICIQAHSNPSEPHLSILQHLLHTLTFLTKVNAFIFLQYFICHFLLFTLSISHKASLYPLTAHIPPSFILMKLIITFSSIIPITDIDCEQLRPQHNLTDHNLPTQ